MQASVSYTIESAAGGVRVYCECLDRWTYAERGRF